MKCKTAWNREFVDMACTKTFRNTALKTHRENVLLDREKCMMPETQHLVVREKQARTANKLLEAARIELDAQQQLVNNLERTVYNIRQGANIVNGGGSSEEKKAFVRKCPCEGCKGFLSTKWKCGICEKYICPDCNEEKTSDGDGVHVCDPNNVETVKLLKKDTKPCPKCGTLICKISGCSQMWCPDCHTAFNWNTMQIETGIIHNPHYYDFQRTNVDARPAGRNLGDIPCGGFPDYYEINRLVRRDYKHPLNIRLTAYHRTIGHILDHELRYVYNQRDPDNSDVRVKFMMDDMTEDELKIVIQKREKAYEKKRDIANILRMFGDTGADIMRQIVVDPDTAEANIKVLDQLSEYTNRVFNQIHKRYNCVTPYITSATPSLVNQRWK